MDLREKAGEVVRGVADGEWARGVTSPGVAVPATIVEAEDGAILGAWCGRSSIDSSFAIFVGGAVMVEYCLGEMTKDSSALERSTCTCTLRPTFDLMVTISVNKICICILESVVLACPSGKADAAHVLLTCQETSTTLHASQSFSSLLHAVLCSQWLSVVLSPAGARTTTVRAVSGLKSCLRR